MEDCFIILEPELKKGLPLSEPLFGPRQENVG